MALRRGRIAEDEVVEEERGLAQGSSPQRRGQHAKGARRTKGKDEVNYDDESDVEEEVVGGGHDRDRTQQRGRHDGATSDDDDDGLIEEEEDMDDSRYYEDVSPIPKLSELRLTGLPTNRTHNRDDMRRIQRENVMLLGKLEEIQRKGGAMDTRPHKSQKHVASSSVNRRKHQRETANQNKAFLKRLQGVKSTVPKPTSSKSKARPGPPRQKKPARKLVQPEWND
ncbi:hypothetical protein PTSG_08334 [Salpingoeca rosetta]|uniref:Cilia- and flagella-associated protein 97 n=1 Tax=Salpingoeca rosetta (strain ATCC 50818 / BSB-021) TaxID=946362 RepID=F2UJE3_SALR5|nr:uncharacterized protein PTSG_08334 [Salpingoeca rosetta]EGD77242.1 hypothetical protein PTSG_08334 [Salpingoeca rosetta]|eukprot:XP_004990586.1 hypothetical protein PTSG_08334 [Salpingoeca rosetta]